MIVWTGSGFLIAIVGILTMVFAQLLGNNISGSATFYQENPWLILAAMFVSAVLTYIMNITFLKPTSIVVADVETGKERRLKIRHTLLFISTKWWPAIFMLVGIVLTYVKS